MTITISNVIAYRYNQASQLIHDLKARALKTKEVEKSDGFKKVKVQIVTGHINPKHPEWAGYVGAKRYANLLLGAVLLLKYDTDETRKLKMHSQAESLRQQRRLAVKAQRTVVKLLHKLEKHPELFKEVETWHTERQAARAAKEVAHV